MNQKFIEKLKRKSQWVRQTVLEMCLAAGAGHIAPAFSCVEILVALYYGNILCFKSRDIKWKDRDRFILSKGHGCAALYAILADLGFLSISELKSYCQSGSRLGGHSESNVPGIEASTGSLGHGLSIGAGIAFAAKLDGKKYLTVVLLGDGECQEGSVWEAAMFSAQHHLNNLIAIIDRNKLQAIDYTEKAVGLEPFSEKWSSFGWEVRTINGHSFEELLSTFSDIRHRRSNKPLAIIALTTKGKGISFMENKPIWHFRVPVGEEVKIARKELKEK